MFVLYKTMGTDGERKSYVLRTGELNEIAETLLYQDCLDCLEHQGRQMGTKKDQKELNKIAALREAADSGEVTKTMVVNFGFVISTGTHECVTSAKTQEELIQLCELMEELHRQKKWKGSPAGKRFEEILEELRNKGIQIDDSLIARINRIQYIL